MGLVINLKRTALLFLSGAVAVGVIICSEEARNGVQNGLILCVDKVIPSLFLFTAAALFIAYTGAGDVLAKILSPITKPLLSLEGNALIVWIMSTVSGYPVGAKLIGTLYKNGNLTRAKALKMLTFSINAGPAFIVTAVGVGTLGSVSDGRRLLVAHLLATFIIVAVVQVLPDRIFSKDALEPSKTAGLPQSTLCVSDAIVQSVSDTGKAMLNVCAFVVFFSGVGSLLAALPNSIGGKLTQALEVTVGVQDCTRSQLPLVAFLLGFGGLSVIFQVKAAAGRLNPTLALIILSRLVHGTLSALIICGFEILFPRTVSTGSFATTPPSAALHTSPFAAAALMLLCAVLLCFVHSSLKGQNRVTLFNS